MLPKDNGELKCLVCGEPTSRTAPQRCTKCLLVKPVKASVPVDKCGDTLAAFDKPVEKAPLYVSDKTKKLNLKKV